MLIAISNKIALLALMAVLILFVVLLAVLGIVFIIALRKRAPVVKVVMAPMDNKQPAPAAQPAPAVQETAAAAPAAEAQPAPAAQPAPEEPITQDLPDTEDEDREDVVYVKEGQERIRYDRSFEAKIIQLKDDSKEWYTTLKNELLSYKKVRSRISWRHENFQMGRMKLAKFVVRGKTLCLMLAVEPAGYSGTKFAVEDVSNISSSADTPTLYRIKSVRRAKYAVEMIAGIMKELGVTKQNNFEAQDYFLPYEGTMALIQRGLIKRVISNTSRTFEIRELIDNEDGELPATMEFPATSDASLTTDMPDEDAAKAATEPAPTDEPPIVMDIPATKDLPVIEQTAEKTEEPAPVESPATEEKPAEEKTAEKPAAKKSSTKKTAAKETAAKETAEGESEAAATVNGKTED